MCVYAGLRHRRSFDYVLGVGALIKDLGLDYARRRMGGTQEWQYRRRHCAVRRDRWICYRCQRRNFAGTLSVIRFLLGFVALSASIVLADARDITTLKGETFYSVTITRVEKTGIAVMHRNGVAFLDFLILPEEIRREFGYTSEGYAAGQALLQQQQIAAAELQRRLDAEAAARQEQQRQEAAARVEASRPIVSRDYSVTDYSARTYGTNRYSERSYTGGTVSVRGYYRKNGTYVQPHTRRAPRRR